MTAGMPRRVRSLFEGFGYSAADITPDLKRRLMALMLLHRFSDPIRHFSDRGLATEGRRSRRIAGFAVADLNTLSNEALKISA